MAGGTMQGELKGAPLRCSLDGARIRVPACWPPAKPGSTYAFTGEGIGKAMETGMLAAPPSLLGHAQQLSDGAVRADYEAAIRAAALELYRKAARSTGST
jgi:hypothetical protein